MRKWIQSNQQQTCAFTSSMSFEQHNDSKLRNKNTVNTVVDMFYVSEMKSI